MNNVPLNFALYGASQQRPRRRTYWKTRSEKLHDRLEREQEIYDERRYEWALEEEIYAEHRQQRQFDEREALSERGVEPGAMGIASATLPILRGTGFIKN